MVKINIDLSSVNRAKEFVAILGAVPYMVDIQSGRYIVNAKSILGIFSLDLSEPVEMVIHDDNCQELLDKLGHEGYIVK